MKTISIVTLILIFWANGAQAQGPTTPPAYLAQKKEDACSTNRRAEVSVRLEVLRGIDQATRQAGHISIRTDLENRQEVASLFAEGCFTTGRDYHNAAVVFQHGSVPDHYYQTYVWAKQAVELGDAEAKWLIPRAIDRYALNSGYNQLFATNLVTESYFSDANETSRKAWCVWPTTRAVSDHQRVAMGVNRLDAQIARAQSMTTAPIVSKGICPITLPDMPRGLFPGIW